MLTSRDNATSYSSVRCSAGLLMTSRLARVLLPCSRKQSSQSLGCSATRIPYTRRLHDYNTKYADKIRKAAEE